VTVTFGNVEETKVDQIRNSVFSDGVTLDLPSVVGYDRVVSVLVVESRLQIPEQKSVLVVVIFWQN